MGEERRRRPGGGRLLLAVLLLIAVVAAGWRMIGQGSGVSPTAIASGTGPSAPHAEAIEEGDRQALDRVLRETNRGVD